MKNRNSILPLLEKLSSEKKYEFSIGLNAAFEFAVLEYPYAFWQSGQGKCENIPGSNSPAQKIIDELDNISGFSLFTDKSGEYFAPLFYQSFTELGYYNFDYNAPEVLKLIESNPFPSYKVFLPKNTPVKYKPEVLQRINHWLQYEGKNIIYVNGGNDPWSNGAGMKLIGKTNSFVVMKENGSYSTSIKDLDEKDKEKVFGAIKNWLGIKLNM